MRGNQFDVPTPNTAELAYFSRAADVDHGFLQHVRLMGHVRRRADKQGVLHEVRADAQEPATETLPVSGTVSREDLRASLREKFKQRL
jgi:hypothetical protein